MSRSLPGFLLVSLLAVTLRAAAGDWDLSGDVGLEARHFPGQGRFAGQSGDLGGSLRLNLEARWRSEDGRQRARFKPFLRLDSADRERSHFDLREAWWAWAGDGWEVLAGSNRVFWGVAESRHLVDIVNQTDGVEDPDGEQKLGQPMVNLTLMRDWGQLEVFVMPWFRERTYPGADGRLRPALPVATGNAVHESAAGAFHTDLALRWSHYYGDVDIGVSVFHGTGREPKLLPAPHGPRLVPFYHQVTQLGLDLQYTREAWLWKLEAIARDGLDDTFLAAVAGFEYTFHGVRDSAVDVGLLVEYLRDGRAASEPLTPFDDDLFLGTRLAFNDVADSSVLAGAVLDRDMSEWFFNLEAERRIGDSLVAEARLRLFHGAGKGSAASAFDRDDYLELRLSRYF